MTAPLISVLMPCYNAAAWLIPTISSVLNQTYSNIELIVVDDGSSDNSSGVLAKIKDARLSVLRQSNSGAAAARNRAFQESHGEFVLYLDADDLIAREHITALYQAAAATPGTIAFSQWDRFRVDPSEANFPWRVTYQDGTGPEWLAKDWSDGHPMAQCGTFLLPRTHVSEHGGWNERLSLIDDFEFFARMIARSKGVRFAVDARLYYRSGIVGSLSGRKCRQSVESAYHSISLGTDHLLAVENSARTRRACANIFQNFNYTYYPSHQDLRKQAIGRIIELGGSDLQPDGPPGFRLLRPLVGWRLAKALQRTAEALRRLPRINDGSQVD